MRSLADIQVTKRALAALVTATACWPRLAEWPERAGATWFLSGWIFIVAFALWSFVFGWHTKYSGRSVFNFEIQPKLWLAATGYAVVAAIATHFLIDPQLRPIAPADFPTDHKSWLAMTLFSLAFEPLFLCFAPFAFFIRLAQRIKVATAFTVTFGLFILALRLGTPHALPPISLVVELLVLRVIGGFVGVWFYLRGGTLLVWWVVLLVQLRYLIELAATVR
jgi:hypothetical protein